MRNSGSGTSLTRGCGCFSLGFFAGTLCLPVLIYLLLSVPLVYQQISKFIDLERIRARIQEILSQKPLIGLPAEEEEKGDDPAAGSVRKLIHEDLLIQYQCTRRASFNTPFIHGDITNNGKRTVRRLILEATIGTSPSKVTESFQILKGTSDKSGYLAPGETRSFVIHPTDAPSDWSPGHAMLAVKELAYRE